MLSVPMLLLNYLPIYQCHIQFFQILSFFYPQIAIFQSIISIKRQNVVLKNQVEVVFSMTFPFIFQETTLGIIPNCLNI